MKTLRTWQQWLWGFSGGLAVAALFAPAPNRWILFAVAAAILLAAGSMGTGPKEKR